MANGHRRVDYEASINGALIGIDVTELKIPKIAEVTEDVLTGGMLAPIKGSTGTYEGLEMDIKTVGENTVILDTMALQGIGGTIVRLMGALENDEGDVLMEEITVRGRFAVTDTDTIQRAKSSPVSNLFYPLYMKRTVNGQNVREMNIKTGLDTVNGVQRNARRRQAIGRS